MNADSVKARLKNFAVSSGCTFQEALVYYGLERTIYRISASPYASHFVLKGGIFLYAVFNRKYERTTTDVDLLARRISNSAEEMKAVFRDIFTQDTDDALVFDLDSITAEDITEFKACSGTFFHRSEAYPKPDGLKNLVLALFPSPGNLYQSQWIGKSFFPKIHPSPKGVFQPRWLNRAREFHRLRNILSVNGAKGRDQVWKVEDFHHGRNYQRVDGI